MASDASGDRLQALGMLASALAGRPVAVAELQPGERSWTDGQTIFVDAAARIRAKLEAIAVQASMIAAGSLDPEVVRSAGPPSAAGQALSGGRGSSRTSRQWRPAAGHLGFVGQPRHRKSQRFARRFAEHCRRAGSDRRPGAGIRRDPRGEGTGRVLPTRPNKKTRQAPDMSREAAARKELAGPRRRRDRRFRRSRPVHQSGRRRRLYRQVAEEDAVVGAQDRSAGAGRPARITRRTG